MTAFGALRNLAGGRLGRRLFLLFLLAAVLPLVVSDWVLLRAVTEVTHDGDMRQRMATTKQVSRQVYERLLLARTLLSSLPATQRTSQPGGSAIPALPGAGQVFRSIAEVAPDGRILWSTDTADGKGRAQEAGDGDPDNAAAAQRAPEALPPLDLLDTPMQLRATVAADGSTRVWMARVQHGTSRWLAELNPDHLWGPLHEAGEDGAWLVQDQRGRQLLSVRSADFPAGWAAPADGPAPDGATETSVTLPLAGGFNADSWTFVQRSPVAAARWKGGAEWKVWLVLVGTAGLLAIAWLILWQIRRTLVPLHELTDGTRRLAAGATSTRVAIQRDDEIGTLAGSFNDMAAHIEFQLDTLTGLTEIDRDILAGAPFVRLAERVLRRLDAMQPDVSARLSWREGELSLHLAWLAAGDDTTRTLQTSEVRLDLEQLAAYQLLVTDSAEPSPRPVDAKVARPWLPNRPLLREEAPSVVTLPLRQQDQTRALIAFWLPQGAPAASWQPARDLRDRLSVALAARARENELVYRAAHDSLTGLANRYGLNQRLDAMLASTTKLAVLCIDLDHFKDVNDSRGHEVGDELLREASGRLLRCAPANALVARQGGDEFAIVLPCTDEAMALAVASAAVATLSLPYALAHGQHVLGASIGITLSPAHGRTREDLLRRADVALYAAKAAGRGRHRLFTSELDVLARDRVLLVAELRLALERSEFIVHYQPRVRSDNGSIRSAEALVRWQHPQRGLVFPDSFIEAAEASGLIEALGLAVLQATCAQLAHWRRIGLDIDRVSVNVSPQQLINGGLPDRVREALDRHQLPATALELEVTESLLVGDASSACEQLKRLRDWGVTIALDDFGTGYSSMATLRQLPIDVMKVDRSFVTDVCNDKGALAVTSAIVALAQSMKLHLVAEGIETEDQAEVLRRMGCHELQGFLYSRPVASHQFEQLPGVGRRVPALAGSPEPALI